MDSKPGAAGAVEIVGRSLAFQQVLNLVRMVANIDSVTLIQGETGTGKEVIARAIHNQSSRRQGPFVTLNCAVIPGPCWKANSLATKRRFHGRLRANQGAIPTRRRGHVVPRNDLSQVSCGREINGRLRISGGNQQI